MQTPIRNVQIRIGASCWGMQPADMSESSIPVSRLRVADPKGLVEAIRGSELEQWILNGHRGESGLTRVMLPGLGGDTRPVGDQGKTRPGSADFVHRRFGRPFHGPILSRL